MKIFVILSLLALAASSASAQFDACTYGQCQQQPFMQPIMNPCNEFVRQQCSPMSLPWEQSRRLQLSSCQVMRQQCCQQMRLMAQQYHCQAICTMVQSIMQQVQFDAGFVGEPQAQAQAQVALNLPSMCGEKKNPIQIETPLFDLVAEELGGERAMAAEEGVVIACHNKDEFDAQMTKAKEAGKVVIIDFTASWCGPCRFIAPVFAEYAKKFPGAVFLKVDVDELKEVAEKYNVEAMPTFLFIKDGAEADKVVGARKDDLQNTIVKHVGATAASASA